MTDAEIIGSVQQFSVIWDKRNPNHKNKLIVQNAWKSIASALNLPVDLCKLRFQNIRHRYARERRALINSARSGAEAYEMKWPHFSACSFLNRVIVPRNRRNYKDQMPSTDCTIPQSNIDVYEEDSLGKNENNIATVSKLLQEQTSEEDDLTLNDVLSNHNISQQKTVTQVNTVDTPSCSRSIQSCDSARRNMTLSSSDSEVLVKFPTKRRRERAASLSDEIKCLNKTITGAFIKFNELCAQSSEPEKVPLELIDDDYSFGRTVALSLKRIRSEKMKLLIQSQIMRVIADAVNED